MKKLLLIAIAFAFSSSLFAAATVVSGNVTVLDCDKLDEDVSLPLSANVGAAYNCTDTVDNSIRISTCHTAGRIGARSAKVACEVKAGDATDDPTIAACDTTGDESTYNVVVAEGASIYTAATTGGTVQPRDYDGSLCDDAGLKAALPDK